MHFVMDQGSWHDTKALAVGFSGFSGIYTGLSSYVRHTCLLLGLVADSFHQCDLNPEALTNSSF